MEVCCGAERCGDEVTRVKGKDACMPIVQEIVPRKTMLGGKERKPRTKEPWVDKQ
jgi:hypothetical protein